jgi:hypothetical protein
LAEAVGRSLVVQKSYAMNGAYLTVLAALGGSVIGALASLGTTWLNQRAQQRGRRDAQIREGRERLYEEFVDEASTLFADSLTHDLPSDASKFVHIYALIGKLRLVSSAEVVARAEDVMRRIAESYRAPVTNFEVIAKRWEQSDLDIIRDFSEACREDLRL